MNRVKSASATWLDAEPIAEHPAKFSPQILLAIHAAILQHHDYDEDGCVTVLDPFAGIGGIHDMHGVMLETYACELQPGWARASAEKGYTWCGDWFDFDPASAVFFRMDGEGLIEGWTNYRQEVRVQPNVIATSCTYGNRMADKHNATDDSKRLTYAHRLRANGEELLDNNSGGMQWGDDYRAFHFYAWRKVAKLLPDGGLFVLNVKDHLRAGKLQQVPQWHRDTVARFGMRMMQDAHIEVKGMGFGANQQLSDGAKVDYEHVYVFRKQVES